MNTNRQWTLAQRPFGKVGPENFEYQEVPIPTPGDGEVLVRNLYLSFDPTQRGWMEDRESYMPPVQLGEPMRAGSVGQVTESNHPDFAAGELVQTLGGWQDFVVVKPAQGLPGLTKLPPGADPELVLSVLGTTGLTAYWGLLDLGKPRSGETVLVSGAAGERPDGLDSIRRTGVSERRSGRLREHPPNPDPAVHGAEPRQATAEDRRSRLTGAGCAAYRITSG